MNKERILALADLIEGLPWTPSITNERGFNMNRFVRTCGTPACIAGWAAWEALDRPNVMEELEDRVEGRAQEYLDLPDETAAKLFWGGTKPLESITPSQAAKVLRHLAETGTVDWRLAEQGRD